ncbi:MAG TPA: serine hydrolase domain-containing protein [Gemmatimonadaceae bacterium]|nr:serine hydrolase domain-containing protein [Gemmatimonadaceae bacterium]
MRRLLAVATLLLAYSLPAAAQANRAALVARLDSLANAPILENRAVGATVIVLKGGDTLINRGYGKADVELGVATPLRGVYEIGSVTKQFTAAAILQLRDAGKIDLDADVTRYLPTFNTRGNKVTVRRLLDHTSGIKGLTEIPAFRTLQNSGYPRDSALAVIGREPFDFAPGEAQIYNNSAFILLGHIIEKTSGMTYEDYIEQKIFAPLGMKNSSYCNNLELVPGRVNGYAIAQLGIRKANRNDHTWPFSAGSICSSAEDLLKWMVALHTGKVLTPASYREMTSASKLNDGTVTRYGMGLAVGNDVRGSRMIGHGGSIDGFTSDARWYPDSNLYVVVLFNSGGPVSPSALASELAGAIIPQTLPVLRPFAGDATPLVGKYSGPSRGRVMTIDIAKDSAGRVMISLNGQPARPLPWIKEWSFRQGDSFLTFERAGTSGPATLLRFDGGAGAYYKLKRQ